RTIEREKQFRFFVHSAFLLIVRSTKFFRGILYRTGSIVLLCKEKEGTAMAGQEAQGLLAVWTDIAPEAEAEFNEWYNTEHIPQLVGIPGIISGRRYQAVDGSPKYLALYDLAIPEVVKSDAFRQLRESPTLWSKKIVPLFRNPTIGTYRKLFSCSNYPT